MLEGLRERALKHKNIVTLGKACLSSSSSNCLYVHDLLTLKSISDASEVCRSKSDLKRKKGNYIART